MREVLTILGVVAGVILVLFLIVILVVDTPMEGSIVIEPMGETHILITSEDRDSVTAEVTRRLSEGYELVSFSGLDARHSCSEYFAVVRLLPEE